MNRILTTLLLCIGLCTGLGFAQGESVANPEGIQPYMGLDLDWCRLATNNSISGGLRGGAIINPYVSAGLQFLHVMNDVSHPFDTIPQSIKYDVYGAFVEGSLPLKHGLRVTMPLMVGAGEATFTAPGYLTARKLGWFVVTDLGLNLESKLGDNFRTAFGGGYRLAISPTRRNVSSSDLSTFYLGLTLKVGDFPG